MTARTCSVMAIFLTGLLVAGQSPSVPKPLLTLPGHTDPVYAVSYSPDGTFIATGSFDKTIKLWDTANGKELRTFAGAKGHQSLILSIAFSPQGDLLASGGADNSTKIWDVPALKPTTETVFGGKTIFSALSSDGKLHAIGNDEGKLRIVATADSKVVHEIATGSPIVRLAFVPNSPTVVTCGADRILRYWNATDGKAIGTIGTGSNSVSSLSALGSTVITLSEDGTVQTWPNTLKAEKSIVETPDAIIRAAVTSDGNYLATVLADRRISILQLNGGKILATLPAPAGTIEDLVWNGDNQTLAVASGKKVTLWGTDGKTRGEVEADAKTVRAVSFTNNRTELLTAGDEGLKLWKFPFDPKKPVPAKAVIPDAKSVQRLQILPNGQLITSGMDKTIKSWDLNSGKEIKNFGTLSQSASILSATRDGSLLAVAAGKELKLWQTSDGKELPLPAVTAHVTSIDFSSDRQFLAAGTEDKQIAIFEIAKNLSTHFYRTLAKPIAFYHPSQPLMTVADGKSILQHSVPAVRSARNAEWAKSSLVTLPNTNSVLIHGSTKTVTRVNIGNLLKENSFELATPAKTLAISRNGQLLAAASPDNTILIYTMNNSQMAGSFKSPAGVKELEFLGNGQSLAGRQEDKTVRIWNVQFNPGQPLPEEFGSMIQSMNHPASITTFAILDDQKLLTGSGDGAIRLWKVASDQPRSIPHPNLVDCVAFNSDGTRLATACHDGVVRIYDLTKPNNPLVKDIKAHVATPQSHPVYVVLWSPDGKMLVSGSYDRSIKLWDATSGNLIREIKGFPEPPPAAGQPIPPGHRDQVFCLAFSKDGKQLASGSSDRTVKLWDPSNGNLIRDFPNPNLKSPGPGQPVPSQSGFIHSVQFSEDAKSLISAGTAPRNGGMICVWNLADGKLKASSNLPFGPVYSIDPARDGKTILVGCGSRLRTSSEAEAYVLSLPGG